jgi:hypothetical protein
LAEAWELDREDRELLAQTFEEYVNAKNPTKNNQMKQENL